MLGDMQVFVEEKVLKMKALIIGKGVAAEILLDQLLRNSNKLSFTEYILFHNPQLAPACTHSSTAIVVFRGITQGVSPLGDEIFSGQQKAFKYYEEFQSAEAAFHYQIIDPEDLRGMKRYRESVTVSREDLPFKVKWGEVVVKKEPCFVLHPSALMKEFEKKNNHVSIQRKEEFVTGVSREDSSWNLKTLKNTYRGDVLFNCSGIYQDWSREQFELTPEQELNPVQGSYLEFPLDLEIKSFSMSMNKLNLIYRAQEKVLLMGSTSDFQQFFKPVDFIRMKAFYTKAMELFPELLNLIRWEDVSIKTGIRARGKGRRMIVDLLQEEPDAWLFNGFYKNGFSLPLEGAQKILKYYQK